MVAVGTRYPDCASDSVLYGWTQLSIDPPLGGYAQEG